MQCRWQLLILPWVRAITREVARLEAVIADYLTLWSLLVITTGSWG